MRVRMETVANICVILMSVVVSVVSLKTFVLDKYLTTKRAVSEYQVGETVAPTFSGVGISGANLTLLLFVNSQCHYCNEGAPFYRDIVALRTLAPNAFRSVVMSVDGVEAGRRYSNDHKIAADEVVAAPRSVLTRIAGTPTLLLVDRVGRVVGRWTGQLSEEDKRAVVRAVRERLLT